MFLMISAGNHLLAQKTEIGLRFMPTISKYDLKDPVGNKYEGKERLGWGYAGFIGFNFADNWSIKAEAIYNELTQKENYYNIEYKTKLTFVNVPLYLAYNTGKLKPVNFNILFGPQLNFSVENTVNTTGTNGNNDPKPLISSPNNFDLGFDYGAGVDFGINRLKTLRLGLGVRGAVGSLSKGGTNQSATPGTHQFYIVDKPIISSYGAFFGISYIFRNIQKPTVTK